MHVPPPFDGARDAHRWLPLLLSRNPLVTLVSGAGPTLAISHLPVVARLDARGDWMLLGHWARSNPQWQGLDGQDATAVLHGPHCYASPRWYPDPSRAVPTWLYAVAHLTGRVRVRHDPVAVLELTDELARHFEDVGPDRWTRATADPSLAQLGRAIVGFELQVRHVEVALKLNQHHDASKRRFTIDRLRESGRPDAIEVADWMERACSQPDGDQQA